MPCTGHYVPSMWQIPVQFLQEAEDVNLQALAHHAEAPRHPRALPSVGQLRIAK